MKIDKDTIVAIKAELSDEGVSLVLAAMKMGLTFALMPLREPAQVIDSWLNELRINKVLTSKDLMSISSKAKNNLDEYDFTTIMMTSGSSAKPKSVLAKAEAHFASAKAVNNYFSFTSKDCWALNLPLYHVSGFSILSRSLLSGGDLLVCRNHQELAQAVNNNSISHLSLVPTQLKRLMDDGVDLSALKAVIIGGDHLPAALREKALSLSVPLYETYGLTETSSMIHVISRGVGVTLPHCQIDIGHGQEILVRGSSMFCGYINADGVTNNLDTNGYFNTMDMGDISPHGMLNVVGRKHNRIISGGENIQGEEVERVLEEYPDIDRAVVIGVSDSNYGMRPVAFILSSQPSINYEHLHLFLQRRLASFKCPQKIYYWPVGVPDTKKKPRLWLKDLYNKYVNNDKDVIVRACE